jgi:hypothetical protein
MACAIYGCCDVLWGVEGPGLDEGSLPTQSLLSRSSQQTQTTMYTQRSHGVGCTQKSSDRRVGDEVESAGVTDLGQRIVLGAEDHLPASIPVEGLEAGL